MTWQLEEIRTEWLHGAVIDVTPERLVDAFNRTESVLGREWMDRFGRNTWSPALIIAAMGEKLAALDGVVGAEKLIDHIKAGERFALAELTAVYLLRRARPQIEVEIYPQVIVGSRERVPDFRAREALDAWVYVEVAYPDMAQTQKSANAVLQRLSQFILSAKKEFAVEIFLLREPSENEIEELATALPDFCLQEGAQRQQIRDLAVLILNDTTPGLVAVGSHPEDDGRPRIGISRVIKGEAEPPRHVSVRMPYADERAVAFLESEARQLPKEAPGLIMIEMSKAPGASKVWEQLLKRRLWPTLHTRVGGICLFMEGILPTERGIALLQETKMIENSHAKIPLPSWIVSAVADAGAEFKKSLSPPKQ